MKLKVKWQGKSYDWRYFWSFERPDGTMTGFVILGVEISWK